MSVLIMCIAFLATPADAHPSQNVAISAHVTLSLADQDIAAQVLIAKAQEYGGYFASRVDTNVVLKVPRQAFEPLLEFVLAQGKVLTQAYNAEDLSPALNENTTRLASRQEVLGRYDEIIRQASLQAVVSVERHMTQLVQEIEATRGALRVLQHRADLAELTVHFTLANRKQPAAKTQSSFEWLNTVSLQHLFGDFAQ